MAGSAFVLMAYQLPSYAWPTAMALVGVMVLPRGRDDARLAFEQMLAAWTLTVALGGNQGAATQWGVCTVDAALLALFVRQALRSPRHWPMVTAAFQLLAVVTHLGRALDAGVSGWAYLTAELFWSYLCLAVIGYGALSAPRRAA